MLYSLFFVFLFCSDPFKNFRGRKKHMQEQFHEKSRTQSHEMKNFTLSTWSVFPRNSVTILAFICSTGHLLRTLAIMNYHLDTWPVTLHFSEISSRISTAIFILSHTYHCRKVSLFYLNVIGTLFSQGCTSFLHCVDF